MAARETELILYGEKIAMRAIAMIAVMAAMNAAAGYATGIVVLLATAVANITDILTLFASYLGLRLSRKKASRDFKYGFYKAETLAALMVAFVTIFLAIRIFLQGLNRFLQTPEIKNAAFGYISVLITVLTSIHLYRMLTKAAKVTNSLALRNNAEDKRNDVLAAAVMFFGIMASYFRVPYVEGAISMFISLMIFKNGFDNAKSSLFFLLDYWDDPKLINKIKSTIEKHSKIVKEIKQIRLRRAGTVIFGEIYVTIDPWSQIQDLRVELDRLNKEILAVDQYIKRISIYTVVPKPGTVRVAIPIRSNSGLKSPLARNFSKTKKYLIASIGHKRIYKWDVVDFPFKDNEFDEMMNFFKKRKVNIVVDNGMHSLFYSELIAISNIMVFPHFSNVKDAEGMLKLLMINN